MFRFCYKSKLEAIRAREKQKSRKCFFIHLLIKKKRVGLNDVSVNYSFFLQIKRSKSEFVLYKLRLVQSAKKSGLNFSPHFSETVTLTGKKKIKNEQHCKTVYL